MNVCLISEEGKEPMDVVTGAPHHNIPQPRPVDDRDEDDEEMDDVEEMEDDMMGGQMLPPGMCATTLVDGWV